MDSFSHDLPKNAVGHKTFFNEHFAGGSPTFAPKLERWQTVSLVAHPIREMVIRAALTEWLEPPFTSLS